jgi:hypothetical protein
MTITFEGIDYQVELTELVKGDWYIYSDKNVMFKRQYMENWTNINRWSFKIIEQ